MGRVMHMLGAVLGLVGLYGTPKDSGLRPTRSRSGGGGIHTRQSLLCRRQHSARRRMYEHRVAEAIRSLRRERISAKRVLAHTESWEHACDRRFGRHEDPVAVAKRIVGVR